MSDPRRVLHVVKNAHAAMAELWRIRRVLHDSERGVLEHSLGGVARVAVTVEDEERVIVVAHASLLASGRFDAVVIDSACLAGDSWRRSMEFVEWVLRVQLTEGAPVRWT